MLSRCLNPHNKSFKDYGGRGITVCERWREFSNFLTDMGERPEALSIDRINNEGDYEPGNCRWATRLEQRLNRRKAKSFEIGDQFFELEDRPAKRERV